MTNAHIADTFDHLADLLEFQNANPFRVRAYRNAARTIRGLADSLAARVDEGDRPLTEIDGIGADLADKIKSLLVTGTIPLLEELKAQIPASVLALMRIPGLGPKKAAALFQQLDIRDLDQLRAACEAGKVRALKGFGAKTEQTILEGISLAEVAGQRLYWSDADELAQALRAHLSSLDVVERLELAGSYRRGKETVGDLDVLVVSRDVAAVMDR
ncbi:MAG TPA: helix-hairpin-helix domain-containing protein, partial [Pirellulaceae bacterium]|nr:helix-hairpin-helix domain-containing protein [Pirellulaceae bacterium]